MAYYQASDNTKTELVQVLLVEELLNKRLDNIRALKHGLMVLGFADMCWTNIDLTSPLYLYTPKEFLAADFLKLVQEKSKQPPITGNHICGSFNSGKQSLQQPHWWNKAFYVRKLMQVIHNITITLVGAVASLPLLLRFVTGHISVGLSKPIKIYYLCDDKLLPEAECCFNMLKLPTAHCTKETFEFIGLDWDPWIWVHG